MRLAFAIFAAAAALAVSPAAAQYRAPEHKADWPGMVSGNDGFEGLDPGPELQRGRSARAMLADSRKLNIVLNSLQPQRKALVDAYVVSVALDSDPVFGRE
ncbi:peptidase C13, partial [Escherichia coli]|nr:peptidase C13 [Escherichia coli]